MLLGVCSITNTIKFRMNIEIKLDENKKEKPHVFTKLFWGKHSKCFLWTNLKQQVSYMSYNLDSEKDMIIPIELKYQE